MWSLLFDVMRSLSNKLPDLPTWLRDKAVEKVIDTISWVAGKMFERQANIKDTATAANTTKADQTKSYLGMNSDGVSVQKQGSMVTLDSTFNNKIPSVMAQSSHKHYSLGDHGPSMSGRLVTKS